MPACIQAPASGLHAHKLHRVVKESAEYTKGVGAAADAGIHPCWKSPLPFQDLLPGLFPYDGLKIGDHLRKGMCPARGSQYIMGVIHICRPVAQGLIDRVL